MSFQLLVEPKLSIKDANYFYYYVLACLLHTADLSVTNITLASSNCQCSIGILVIAGFIYIWLNYIRKNS